MEKDAQTLLEVVRDLAKDANQTDNANRIQAILDKNAPKKGKGKGKDAEPTPEPEPAAAQ